MIRVSRYLLAAGVALALLAPVPQADAAQLNMCRAGASGASPGPGRWTAPASGTNYTINNLGCILISPVDLGDAQAGGFIARSQIFNTVANALLAAGSVVIPGGTYLESIIIQETSGATVTGGVKIGTTSGGTEVVSGATCASSCLTWIPDASISTRIFAATAPVTLFIGSVGTFPVGPSLNVTFVWGYW